MDPGLAFMLARLTREREARGEKLGLTAKLIIVATVVLGACAVAAALTIG